MIGEQKKLIEAQTARIANLETYTGVQHVLQSNPWGIGAFGSCWEILNG
jgi:hypothetical protein